MTQDEILDMWGRAGGGAIDDMPYALVEAFAKLVAARTLMNIDPRSFMSYQEGFEAGVTKEREACAKECEHTALRMGSEWMAQHCAEAIRARGGA